MLLYVSHLFFFNDTATTEIYTLSLHDALPICDALMKMDPERFIAVMSHWREYFVRGADLPVIGASEQELKAIKVPAFIIPGNEDRKSTRLNSSHSQISYAVFCLKKKKKLKIKT